MKRYLIGFLLGVLVSLSFFYFIGNGNIQTISNINLQKSLSEKLDNLKESLSKLNTSNWVSSFTPNWEVKNEDKLEKINEIKTILDKEYFDPSMISGSKMWDYAMQAYVAGLWDPFTNYLTAKDNNSLHKELKWSSDFQGIGAVVTKTPEWIMIEQLIKDGPAQKAWLKPLDIILEANWTGLADLPLWDGVNLIKWPAGTEVELTVKRDGKIFKVKVKREKLKLTSVNSKLIDYKWKKIWYISISTIWEETYDQFKKQLQDLLNQKVPWIILDLRWNGGGYLDVGYKIWATWAKKWDIVVQTKYRNPLYNQIFKANVDGILHAFPTIVLVDGYTASAGEIITAAIKENNEKTTKLVWTQTFGKWTIQTIKEFPDGSSLKYTIWKWFTPKWNNVCKKWVLPWNGIKPDVEVKFDSDAYKKDLTDNQLEKAKEVLLKLIK